MLGSRAVWIRFGAVAVGVLVLPVVTWSIVRDDAGSSDDAARTTSTTTAVVTTTSTAPVPAPTEPPPPPPPTPPAECSTFPADSYWHSSATGLPVHPQSAAYVASIGVDSGVKADFGAGMWDGGPIGIPVTRVAAGQPGVAVEFDYADESDPGPYPIPPDALVEGGPGSDGDRHVLALDAAGCRLYELFDAHPNADGSWQAGSGAVYDLRSHALRPAGWTSADAAGLPILPGLVAYDEVAAGRIDHVIRATVPRTQDSYVWPARHAASSDADPALPPMGTRLRLRADVDISGLGPQARVVAQAMKDHGVVVADNGSAWYLSGIPDDRWDNDDLRSLGQLTGADFEAVDATPAMVSPDSAQSR